MNTFVVQNSHNHEVVGVYATLELAKEVACNRSGVSTEKKNIVQWTEHNAHGPSWTAWMLYYYIVGHELKLEK